MAEEGTLSIVRCGRGYQIRSASNHPYDPDRQPYACHDADTLAAFLHHVGTEAAAIRQVCAAVQTCGMAVLRMLLAPGQIQTFFPPAP